MKTIESIRSLKKHDVAMDPEDSIQVAARNVWLAEFPYLLDCEEGCQIGKDIVADHQMRVSCRRIRSVIGN